MNRLATLSVALLLLPLIAGCNSSAAASAAPSASAVTALAPGQHTTVAFQPQTTYTVPAGWVSAADTTDYFGVSLLSDSNNGMYVFHNVVALSQDATCPRSAEPGVGTKAADMVAWVRSLKGLNVSQPVPVTVSGLQGTQIDVSIKTAWTQVCSFGGTNTLRTVPLFHSATIDWWLAGDEKLRLTFIDLPGSGGLAVTDLDSFLGDGFGDLLTNGMPIVQSLKFATQ